jgi:hypothetical protein
MKQRSFLPSHLRRFVHVSAAVLMLAAARAGAWELGLINTWINYSGHGGDTAHGVNVMVRQEVFKYFDVGGRTGFMRSDPLHADYVPVGLSLALKYPFFEERFVPFVAVMGSLQFYTSNYRNSHASTPYAGFDIRFGERKEWSGYFEGFYQMGHAHLKSDDTARQFNGLGFSWGLSYRF